MEFEALLEGSVVASGDYDDISRQLQVKTTTDRIGKTSRTDHTVIVRVPGQFASGKDFFRQMPAAGGDSPKVDAVVLIHQRDLVRKKLWDVSNSRPLIQKNDRLKRILDRDGTTPVYTVPDPPGLYVEEINVWSANRSVIRFDLVGRKEA